MGIDHICVRGLPHEDVLNNWTASWVLRGGGGGSSSSGSGSGSDDAQQRQHVETHEYVVMRYAEIIGAPEPPTSASVRGWAVQYPFDGQTAEHRDAAPIAAECTARRSANAAAAETQQLPTAEAVASINPSASINPPASALSTFRSDSATLDAVWRLCQYTVVVGALDTNTDSNTRQRDICNLDAMLGAGQNDRRINRLRRHFLSS